uniref:Uncharacterized protein n=1 Tax=Opuntia streptacantha TaxID=393608 RepID=A0A7C8ZW89_OPUST
MAFKEIKVSTICVQKSAFCYPCNCASHTFRMCSLPQFSTTGIFPQPGSQLMGNAGTPTPPPPKKEPSLLSHTQMYKHTRISYPISLLISMHASFPTQRRI